MQDLSNLVVYNDGELELKVSVEKDSVWLNRNQLAELFGRDVEYYNLYEILNKLEV